MDHQPQGKWSMCHAGSTQHLLPCCFQPAQNRLLQFDLYFAKPNTGYNFNIADSTNNGHGGDAGHSSNAAEVHNRDETWYTYANLRPGYTSYIVDGNHLVEQVNSAISNFVTVTIGDEYVKFDNHRGIQKKYKSEFLFALSGQSITYGRINHDIYFSLNRVVYPFTSVTRTGVGLCRAVIRAYDC